MESFIKIILQNLSLNNVSNCSVNTKEKIVKFVGVKISPASTE